MRAVIFTLGCKVNESESALIAASLEDMGIETDIKLSYADIYVLNTCAVTREAEKKSRQLISRVKKFNENAKIYVCGCASQKDMSQFLQKGVEYVCGAQDKCKLIVSAISETLKVAPFLQSYAKQSKTRAFIKVQDGCDNFCSYCVIPYLRGREKSRSIEDIRGEIAATNCPEAVLNGINISSFNDNGKDLAALLYELSGVKKRIRLGSLECSVISEKFLTAAKNLYDFAPQFHLSLQSGSNSVLKAMNRHYTRAQYLEKCSLIYSYFPKAAITCDIIVGFPTETENDFQDSLSIIESAGFARVHAFAFSAREGTAAAKMKDIAPEIKKARLNRLLEAGAAAAKKYAEKFISETADFLAEEQEDGYTVGYTANYLRVYVARELAAGKFYKIKITEIYKDGVKAEIV